MVAAAAAAAGGLVAQARLRGRGRALRHGVGVGLAAPGRRRLLVAAFPASLPPLALAQEVDERVAVAAASNEILPPADVFEKTVRVRFVLQKNCAFGQRFLLVGDDPALGLWDPTEAAALDWSEGHVWTVNMDLPANKSIEFKFLLQDSSGKFRWQDGPNRTIQTGETSNTLAVYEDWDDARNQKVLEEGKLSIGMEEVTFLDDSVGVGGNGAILSDKLQMDGNQEVIEASSVDVCDKKSAAIADSSLQVWSVEANERKLPQKIADALHEKANMAPQNDNIAVCADDDDYTERNGDNSIFYKEVITVEKGSGSIVENDIFWGWKALQHLLVILGFKMDTTEKT